MIHVYTGNGKGKTTAALGLGLRAAGHGRRVLMVQFMKGKVNYGELTSSALVPGFTIRQFGRPDFVDKNNPAQADIDGAREALAFAAQAVETGSSDLLILDELNVALDFKLVAIDAVMSLIAKLPDGMELVITGRIAPQAIIDLADLVTEMREVKHYYAKGVQAREGIEY